MAYKKTSLTCDEKTRERLKRAVARKVVKRNGLSVSMDQHLNELQDLEDAKRGTKVLGSI